MKSSKIVGAALCITAALVLGCGPGSPGAGQGLGETSALPSLATAAAPVALPSLAGATFTTAVGVNEASRIAGWSTGVNARAVSWDLGNGQIPAAATEHLPIAGNVYSAAYGIGGDGLVVGESENGTATVAVAWLNGSATPTQLSLDGFAPPAVALGASGARIVGQAVQGGETVAVIWPTPTSDPVELRDLSSGPNSRAYGISEDGSLVVGEATSSAGAVRAVVWAVLPDGDSEDPVPLAPLAGDTASVAFSVSGSIIVGESVASNGASRAVSWAFQNGTASLPVELGSGSATGVSGINAVGHSAGQATLWALDDILNPFSVATTPSHALSVNSSGLIVGYTGTTAFATLDQGGPAVGATLVANLSSPQDAGTPVIFTAAGQGSSGYEYRFWLYDGQSWTIAQDFSAVATWTLPGSTPAGDYIVGVWVRTNPTSTVMEAQAFVDFQLVGAAPPPTGVTLESNLASPQSAGTPVVFTAAGQGSTNYQYRFWLYDGQTWTIARDFSTEATWTLPGTAATGNYTVGVWVRTDSSTTMQAQAFKDFQLLSTTPPATGATLAANLASPQPAGTPVVFTAAGQGSSGYQYRFWLFDGVTWAVVQDFSPTAIWTLPASTPAGTYIVGVWVRANPASVGMEAQAFVPMVLDGAAGAQAVAPGRSGHVH